MEDLTWNSLSIDSIIYQNADIVTVFKGKVKATGQEVAIKKLTVKSFQDAAETMQELYAMTMFEHENLMKLTGQFLSDSNGVLDALVIVMEYFPEGDLNKEISRRKRINDKWSENELWRHMYELVSAHAYLQEHDIAHRDVKPQNIFVTRKMDNQVILKVGDFGCAYQNSQKDSIRTITGTPLFLSPILRMAYINIQIGRGGGTVKHNVFRSDVFSLGLTFLLMASLQDLNDLSVINQLKARMSMKLEQLSEYPRVREILKYMLAIEEEERDDFIQLKNRMEGKIVSNLGSVGSHPRIASPQPAFSSPQIDNNTILIVQTINSQGVNGLKNMLLSIPLENMRRVKLRSFCSESAFLKAITDHLHWIESNLSRENEGGVQWVKMLCNILGYQIKVDVAYPKHGDVCATGALMSGNTQPSTAAPSVNRIIGVLLGLCTECGKQLSLDGEFSCSECFTKYCYCCKGNLQYHRKCTEV